MTREEDTLMKRCSRIISFFLALTLLIGLLPGSLVIPAFAAVEPKYVVSSNIELTEDTNSTTAPALKKSYITNDVIDKSKGQVFLLANYSSIKDKFPLAYVEIDGLKVYLSDFERYTSLTKIDTSSCPNLQGREVQIRLFKSCPQFKFVKDTGNDITSDIKINFVFQTQAAETEYKLNATAGENGTILQTEYLHSTDDGNSVYGLWVRPDNQYQLLSYTMGSETVSIELKNENYVTWQFPEPDDFGRTYTACNYFELEISKDSDITLNFGPATVELKLVGYMPDHWGLTFYTLFRFASERDKLIETMGYDTIPLVEGSGAKFCYTLQVNGFLDFDVDTTGEDTYAESEKKYKLESFKIYNGTETNEDALLFSMDDPNAIKETYGLSDPHEQWLGGKWPHEYIVYTGWKANVGHAAIARCPDLKQITTEVVAYGRTTTLTSDVKMASDVKEAKDFLQYYTDTYGLDKMGQEAYTEAEKQTVAYQRYCQYSTFRYEMRKVYQEQALKVAFADDPAAALVEAKAALDAAARGEGCNAVSWSFNKNPVYGTHDKPTLTAIPNDGDNVNKTGTSASDAMCAALEAEYPGNWTYNCTSTQFGMFVNSVTAGGENDTGRMNIRDGTNGPGMSYGFWYYNGKFSEWGVSNYYPYDGDVMAWGNPDVTQSWNQAILRFHYKNIGGDTALEAAMKEKGVTFESGTEALKAAFPDINFERRGQFREVSKAELVVQLINSIGTVSPDSGEAINAARAAYDALGDADKAKVYNYSTLTDAEAAFAKLSQGADVKYEDALASTLALLNQYNNASVGSTYGEWLILALARGGIISGTDTSGAAVTYLENAYSVLRDMRDTKMSQPTDYARVTLAMSALGVEAPQSVLDVVRDYDRVAAQGINAVTYALLALDSKPYKDAGDDALRDKYVALLLDNACESGGWVYGGDKTSTADVDMTAMVLQALAPYYLNGDANVKTAVDKGLSALKTMQQSTGGFASYGTYNAESTAQVIVALTALGIDPTSAEWKKTGDPVDALLHFYDASASMFRHTTNGKADQMATEQSAYALVAYSRFAAKQNRLYDMSDAFGESGEVKDPKQTVASAKLEIGSMGRQTVSMAVANTEDAVKSYIDTRLKLLTTKGPTYEVSVRKFVPAVAGTETDPNGTGGSFIATVTITMDSAKDTADIYGTITATKYEAPKEDITVTFQLLGDDHHTIKTDADVHTYRFNADEMPVWIDTVTVTVPGGSTVGDVFKQVLDEKGYTYVGLEQGYISSITTPDNVKLSHKDDKRDNSGWMYVVNDTHPNVGLNSYELKKGDVITWHWCDDYTIEEGSEKWSGSRVIEYIENLIKLIGEVDASDDCKARIDKARAAYDKLTNTEKENVGNYQTLQDAEAKYRSLTGMDALVSLIEEQTWTVSMNDANDAAAVKTWLETKLNALELNGATATATVTALTAATAGTADNKSGTDGSFTFDVTLAVGEGGAQDSRNLTGMTGTITATKLISSDAGVASVSVGGKAGKVDGTTITVVLDYADDAVIPSDANSVSIVTIDPDAQVSDLATADEGVTWTFTVTAEDGSTAEYTIHVSIAENPAEGNTAAVAAAKSMLENASFTYASKDVNSEDAAKTAVEKQIEALLSDKDVSFEVTMTGFTAAQDGTAENESGMNGSFSFTVKLTKGEAETSAEDSVSLSGTITPAQYVKSTNAGVSELKIAGTTATISGNSFTVTVPYGTEITANSFEITLADSKASITTLPHEENGVWSFTVTAEDGSTTATYTVTVTIGKNPEQDSNQKNVDDAKATISSKTFDVKQEDINSEAAMKRYIEDMLRGLGFDGMDMQVEITSFNAAVAGDSQNKDGVNGSFTATVKLTKGSGDALAEGTVSISGTIFATAYSGGNPNPPTPPSRDTYTLTFDTNGGSALKSVDAKAGTTIDLAQYVPVRAGYTFLGWYSDSALKNAVTSITLNRNTTVYAKWDKQNTPSVKNPFTDVKPGDWFYDDVMFVYEKKLMMGTSSTLFSPNEAATRAMLATILWRMDGSPAPKSSAGYSDVPTGQWYSDAIAWATEKGIFEGYGNGTFGPNDPITREQLAAIFYRYASHKGYDMSAVGSLEQFSDKDKASSWALDALKWAIGSGLMNGKGNTLDPTGTATRAEIAAMLHRLVDKYGLVPSTTPSGNTQWTIRSPRTYDSSALGTWNFMLCASAAALLALITAEKRRRQVNYAR